MPKPGGILYLTEIHPAMALLGKVANFTAAYGDGTGQNRQKRCGMIWTARQV